jgi:proteasome lid subunit RPN8/RPN11
MIDRILDHLQAALPAEGCGLLATKRIDGGSASGEPEWVVGFYPGTNIDASPARYTMDPTEVIAALRDMEERGWRLGAIVHSHPKTPAQPSDTDLRESYYPGALMVIVSLAEAGPVIRAWRVDGGHDASSQQYREVKMRIDAGPDPCASTVTNPSHG